MGMIRSPARAWPFPAPVAHGAGSSRGCFPPRSAPPDFSRRRWIELLDVGPDDIDLHKRGVGPNNIVHYRFGWGRGSLLGVPQDCSHFTTSA